MTAQCGAWDALIAFPLSDPAPIADEVATALPYMDECGEWAVRLIAAVQADLARVTA